MAFDPWYKTTLDLNALGSTLKFAIPHDVFSTQKIDEGTLLLLEHLPTSVPRSVLDMGCGYGALGLPVAARFPQASVDLVDRDLLAVEWSTKNAATHSLQNVKAYSSLGYREVAQKNSSYDWILCNVPARIGRPFMEDLFAGAQHFLNPAGELRVVVIQDLGIIVENIAKERAWPVQEVARGPRHIIFALSSIPAEKSNLSEKLSQPEELYTYDQVKIVGGAHELQLKRPFDIAGDRVRVLSALPVLIDALPRRAPESVFCFRCGYGNLPLLGRKLWPLAKVLAFDRDILATTFARANAAALGLEGNLLEIRESVDMARALRSDEVFDLAVGELSPSAGEHIAEQDLVTLFKHLKENGQALILTLEKIEREWITGIAKRRNLSITRLIAREGNVVLRLAGKRQI